MTSVFDHAETFIWSNARLLERRLFAYHFRGGARQAVLAALRAYQNEDGGFGQALEPDIRCPDSQPVPVQHALEIMDAVGADAVIRHVRPRRFRIHRRRVARWNEPRSVAPGSRSAAIASGQ